MDDPSYLTPEKALRYAERMEADARRLREYAQRERNPGLLPDEEGYVPDRPEDFVEGAE